MHVYILANPIVCMYTQVQYTWLYYRFPVIVVKNGCTRYAVTSNQGQYYHHHSSILAQNVYKVAHAPTKNCAF